MQLSPAQSKLVMRMQAGARVFFDQKTGLYCIDESGSASKIDQRTVEALLLSGRLFQSITGQCFLNNEPVSDRPPGFAVGQHVYWERGEKKGRLWATVVRSSCKQVRIKTSEGREHEVRPTALTLVVSA